MTDKSDDAIIHGTGNVFADLGIALSDEDMLKVNLAAAISCIIQRAGMTQTEAAKLTGLDQPKVSHLMRGRVEGFTVERLFNIVARLGCDVDVKIKGPKRRRGTVGRIALVEA